MYRLKRYIIGLIVIIFSALAFADLPQAPNILITDNPYKEVKTVNAPKNRENAELNITVDKINIDEIGGLELQTGDIVIPLPEIVQKDKMLRDNVFYVTTSIDDFPDISTVNGKKTIANIKKLQDNVAGNKVKVRNYNELLIVENGKKHKELYLGVVDRLSGDISKVWLVKNFPTSSIVKLNARKIGKKLEVYLGEYKKLIAGVEKDSVQFIPTLKREMRTFSNNEDRNEIITEYNKETDVLTLESEEGDLTQVLVYIAEEKNNGFYLIEGKNTRDLMGPHQYQNFKEAYVEYVNGKPYLVLGILSRVNRSKDGSYNVAEDQTLNFGIEKSENNRVISVDFADNLSRPGNNGKTYQTHYFFDGKFLIYGQDYSGSSNVRSDAVVTSGLPDLNKYNLEGPMNFPPQLHNKGDFYGWILVTKVVVEIPSDVHDKLMTGYYREARVVSPLIVNITGYWSTTNTQTKEVMLLPGYAIEGGVKFNFSEDIDFNGKALGTEIVSAKVHPNKFVINPGSEISINGERRVAIESFNEMAVLGGGVKIKKVNGSNGKYGIKYVREKAGVDGSVNIKIYEASDKDSPSGELAVNIKNREVAEANITLTAPVVGYNWGKNVGHYGAINITTKNNKVVSDEVTGGYTNKFMSGKHPTGEVSITGRAVGYYQYLGLTEVPKIKFNGKEQELRYISKDAENTNSMAIFEGQGVKFGVAGIERLDGPAGGISFYLLGYDYQEHDITFTVENHGMKSTYNVHIPKMNMRDFVDETTQQENPKVKLDYDKQKLITSLSDQLTFDLIDFKVGTTGDDPSIFGEDVNNGTFNFKVRVPKKVTVKVLDREGEKTPLNLMTQVTSKDGWTEVGNDDNYYYLWSRHSNVTPSSYKALKGAISLSLTSQNLKAREVIDGIKIVGENINLVELVGDTQSYPIVKDVEILIKNEDYVGTYDVRDKSVGTTGITASEGRESFDYLDSNILSIAAITDDNIIERYDDITPADFNSKGKKLEKVGITLRRDSSDRALVVDKNSEKLFSGDVVLSVRESRTGAVFKTATLKVTNRITSEATIGISPFMVKGADSGYSGGIEIVAQNINASINPRYMGSNYSTSLTGRNGQYNLSNSGNATKFVSYPGEKITLIKPDGSKVEKNEAPSGDIYEPVIIEDGGVKYQVDYDKVGENVNGLHLFFKEWDYEAHTTTFTMEHKTFINKYTINIPALDIEKYYDKSEGIEYVNYPTKTLNAEFEEKFDKELLTFKVGTIDYDISILGKDENEKSKLYLKIPKEIGVTFASDMGDVRGYLAVDVTSGNENTDVSSDANYFILKTNNLGTEGEQSNILGNVKLSISDKNIATLNDKHNISINAENINLVEIGVEGTNKKATLVDKINISLSNNNIKDEIDITKSSKGDIVFGSQKIEFTGDKEIEILDKDFTSLYKGTLDELTKTGYTYDKFGGKISYDNTQKKLKVEKVEYKPFNENIYIVEKEKNGIAFRKIVVSLKNRYGFEIFDGYKLDFGDIFKGQKVYKETVIKFKNLENLKISIELPSTSGEMVKIDGKNGENSKVKLENFRVWNLDTKNPKENSFRIGGYAVPTNTTEVGKYKGQMEVTITIIP